MGLGDPNENRRGGDAAALPEMQELLAAKHVHAYQGDALNELPLIVFPAPAVRPLPQLLSYPHSAPLG